MLYDALAEIEKDPRRAAAFRRIASNERRHADIWASGCATSAPRFRPTERPARSRPVHHPPGPSPRDRRGCRPGAGAGGRRGGALRGARRLARGRGDRRRRTGACRDLESPGRRAAARPTPGRAPIATAWRSRSEPAARQRSGSGSAGTGRGRSGTLRAVIFGVSDGLVSNLSLVMGVTGGARPATRASSSSPGSPACWPGRSAWPRASTSRCRASASCSSTRSPSNGPRWRRCPRRRRPSWPPRTGPRGSRPEEAARIAHRIFEDPEAALDMLVREELGLDPDQLGSPWGAAAGSFAAFVLGAVVPVIPYLFGGGTARPGRQPRAEPRRACSRSARRSACSPVAGFLFSGVRQLGIGVAGGRRHLPHRFAYRRRRSVADGCAKPTGPPRRSPWQSDAEYPHDDAALVHQIVGGSEAALATLYDRYGEAIFASACRLTADRGIAEEVVQETFLALGTGPSCSIRPLDRCAAGCTRSAGTVPSTGCVRPDGARGSSRSPRRRRDGRERRRRASSGPSPAAWSWPAPLRNRGARRGRGRRWSARRHPVGDDRDARHRTNRHPAGLPGGPVAGRNRRSAGWPLGTVKTRTRRALLHLREALGGEFGPMAGQTDLDDMPVTIGQDR